MPRSCELAGCNSAYLARGMCNRHYLRWRNAGGKTDPKPDPWTKDMDRELLAVGITPWTERYKPGGRLAKVAERLGVTEQAASDRLHRLKRKAGHTGGQWTTEGLWTEAEDGVIREAMSRDRPGWAFVAADLGRTPAACAVRAYNLRKRERLAS